MNCMHQYSLIDRYYKEFIQLCQDKHKNCEMRKKNINEETCKPQIHFF